ncbi:3-hydroxybutyryl-CoA dehydrogenase [Novosphingobium sp. RD2P27]|uniref:L-gulonate 3-dehydrogenase n=1 Tax=Novosphingobium kalidii TaxID=3230299 RepID=A0ABV2D1G1_9SPHN
MATENPSRIAILGAGRMGRGIATSFALAGIESLLIDLRPRSDGDFARLRETAMAEIGDSVRFLAEAGLLDAAGVDNVLSRVAVVPVAQAPAAIGSCDVIFEGVPETLEAKASAFAVVCEAASPEAIIASTTSTIGADELAAMVTRPERFMNAHWLNPAHLVPLVEVSPATVTDQRQVDVLCDLLKGIGKVPVVCRSSPGYIVPRIQALAMNEAARMVEEGVASAEDIDTAVRVGFGFRFAILGLLEFIDWGGGDILHYASAHLSKNLDEHRFAAPDVIGRNMAEGRNGLRDGKGFYDYADTNVAAYRARRLGEFLAMLQHRQLMPSIKP